MIERREPELMAIEKIARALEPLDVAQRERALKWANERFRLNLYNIVAEGQEKLRDTESEQVPNA